MQPGIDEYTLEGDAAAAGPFLDRFAEASQRLVRMGAEVVIPGDGFLDEFVRRHRAGPPDDGAGLLRRVLRRLR